jgi:hypothetical protein
MRRRRGVHGQSQGGPGPLSSHIAAASARSQFIYYHASDQCAAIAQVSPCSNVAGPCHASQLHSPCMAAARDTIAAWNTGLSSKA